MYLEGTRVQRGEKESVKKSYIQLSINIRLTQTSGFNAKILAIIEAHF